MSSTEPAGGPRPIAEPDLDNDGEIGWGRAILSGLAILVVGIGAAVYGANRILTKALALRRTPREWLATGLFFFVVIALAWILRRLQDRKVI
jgi:hypothetical protein